jgi:aspartyl/asparaginyl beta-hydroxylase (cupin superfamily)
MLEGIWYEFDNTRSHSVENNSNDDRIHLMLDIIPNNILKSNNIKINYISR